jgi:hypothetical protein
MYNTGHLRLPPRGTILTIREPDYMYGSGTLRVRVVEWGDGRPIVDGAEWIFLTATALGLDDREIGPATIHVRAKALAAAKGDGAPKPPVPQGAA